MSLVTTELRLCSNDSLPMTIKKPSGTRYHTYYSNSRRLKTIDMFPVNSNSQEMIEIFPGWQCHIQQKDNNST